MYGRSEYNTNAARIIGGFAALITSVLILVGLVSFVTAETPWGLIWSFFVWVLGLIVAGVLVEWWSR